MEQDEQPKRGRKLGKSPMEPITKKKAGGPAGSHESPTGTIVGHQKNSKGKKITKIWGKGGGG